MEETPQSEKNLNDQFQDLGKNLTEVLRATWNRPERIKFQEEIESGIQELGVSIKKLSDEFQESGLGQQLKNSVKDIQNKVEEGQVEENIRVELFDFLMKLNRELENFGEKIKYKDETEAKDDLTDS